MTARARRPGSRPRPKAAPLTRKKKTAASTRAPESDDQVRWLLHELQVHSEEITVQNEQLVKAQVEIEHARDRYAELYDFAPVGYLLLDSLGQIHECNFAASTLLGRPRRFLLSVPLPALVIAEHRPRLREFLRLAAGGDLELTSDIEVNVKVSPHRTLQLMVKPRWSERSAPLLFTAVIDVTVQRRLESERDDALTHEKNRSRELASEVVERTHAERRIKALLERLVTVQEEERRRLSRDLHDQVGQQLTALRLTLSRIDQVTGDPNIKAIIQAAERIVTGLDHDVDHLGWELRPAALDELGLIPALGTFVTEWSEYHRIPVEFHAPADVAVRLPRDTENHLYRIVQEALNNVVKHAAATRAVVQLHQTNAALRLAIRDDGCGFNATRASTKDGLGLVGMRERVALIGGEVQFDSAAGRGTTVLVRVPLSAALPDATV